MVKKLTSEEFCSVAHRQAYHDEQEQLAVARLLEDQQRRKPSRKSLSRSRDKDKSPEFADFLYEKVGARTIAPRPWQNSLDLSFSPDTQFPSGCLTLSIPRAGLAAPEMGAGALSPFGNASVENAMVALSQSQSLLPPFEFSFGSLAPVSIAAPAEVPLEPSIAISVDAELPPAPLMDAAPVELCPVAAKPASRLQPKQQLPLEAVDFSRAAGSQLPFDLSLRYQPIPAPSPEAPTPAAPQLQFDTHYPITGDCSPVCHLPQLQPRVEELAQWLPSELDSGLKHPSSPEPHFAAPPFEIGGIRPHREKSLPFAERLKRPLIVKPQIPVEPMLPAMSQNSNLETASPDHPTQAVDSLAAPQIACFAGSIQRLFPRPMAVAPRKPSLEAFAELPHKVPAALLAAQSRSARAILKRTHGKCQPFEAQFQFPGNFLKSVAGNWAAANSLFAFNEPIPPKARIASVRRSTLSVVAKTFRASRQTGISVHPDPAIQPPVMRDWQRPEKLPLTRPRLQLRILPARHANSALHALSPFSAVGYQKSWDALRRRWDEAPNDLRWIAMAVPLIIGLIWFADSPSAQSGAKGRITSMIPDVSGMLKTSFSGDSFGELKQNIQRRAAVELMDDFRQGLGDWAGLGDWSRGWTYDPAGFIRPRQIALYSPSLPLEDYRFEFLGAIERKALSWVFRAADVKNYYAARLEVTRGGPLPTVELVRYAVINGRPGPRKSIPLPMQVRQDTIYRVRVDVRGSDFVTTVQGQVVDVFSDDRLPRGGVGFFSEAGEDARLRWVEVSHQYDMLGRLCAYLVPYNVSNSNVRSAP